MSQTSSFVKISGFANNAEKGCVEYLIHVNKKQGEPARRRFREFLQLREDISPVWEEVPQLPSRVFSTAPDVRLPQLDAFLVEVCETLGADPPKPLLAFLSVTKPEFDDARTGSVPLAAASAKIDYGTPKVCEQFAETIERTVQEVLETSKAVDGVGGWRLVGKQVPFEWMARADDAANGIKSNRVAYGELRRCPPRLVHDLMLDNNACLQMEPKIDSITDIAAIDEHTFVQHIIMKSIMFMPPRDVILVRHWRVLNDGCIVHAEFSVEEFPGVPKSGEHGRVRAKLTVGGVVLQPLPNDASACKVWRVSDMDPLLGDAIPAYAIAKLNEFTASMLSNNMFTLAKLVAKSSFQQEMAKAPLVNWNGKVEGLKSVELATDEDERGEKKSNSLTSEIAPYLVGFVLGVSSAVMASKSMT